ncbi:hypothetical protein MHPYR_480025 [uncultured Mycobacterium sp.]|uniref:Uncharacterized protein n=1 Tax=uncultured Mycobacterium sp. TaxID=171292 RepID=A0A1Y5PPC5_9MYCO|nr:hypothetical protein MHPYR_480025 [uncultured Mycobacterium sp.]
MIRGYASAPALFCGFRGGEFSNMKAIVDCADVVDLKLDDTFLGYAQARGFAVDPAGRAARGWALGRAHYSVCDVEYRRRRGIPGSRLLPGTG